MEKSSSDLEDDTTDQGTTTDTTALPDGHCGLTPDQMEARREWVEANLSPYLTRVDEHDQGFTLVFDRTPEAYTAVTEVAWKESQCCGWATFEIELAPGNESIRWHEHAEHPDQQEFFGEALGEILGARAELSSEN